MAYSKLRPLVASANLLSRCSPVFHQTSTKRDTEVIYKHFGIARANCSLKSLGHVSSTVSAFTWLYLVEKSIRKFCSPLCILFANFL